MSRSVARWDSVPGSEKLLLKLLPTAREIPSEAISTTIQPISTVRLWREAQLPARATTPSLKCASALELMRVPLFDVMIESCEPYYDRIVRILKVF